MSLALYWNGRAYYSPALLQWAPTRTFHDPNPPINLEDPPPSGGSGDAPTSTVTTGAGSTRSLTTGANNAPTSGVGGGAGSTRSLTTGANDAPTSTVTTGAGATGSVALVGDAPTSTVTTGAGATGSVALVGDAPTSVVGAGAGLTRSLTTGANNASTATATTGAGSTSGLENPNAALIAQARILLARNLSALRRRWILRLLTRLGV